jgi:hypothetical protein
MLSSLPELFGKNFLIGYVLPALLIVAACIGVTDSVRITNDFPRIMAYVDDAPRPASNTVAPRAIQDASSDKSERDAMPAPIGLVALLGACAAALAVLFLATNYIITQFLQGSGTLNPFRLLRFLQTRKFRKLREAAKAEDDAAADAATELAAYFPEDEALVLPTRFGNISLASQRYVQQIYDIEPIQTWARLEALIPDRHSDLLADAKAQTDFWVNLWIGALSIAALSALLAVLFRTDTSCAAVLPYFRWNISCKSLHACYALIISILMSLVCARGANSAATQYGLYVMSAFDLYRGDLAAKMGLSLPRSVEHEREMWRIFAWTILYRDQKQALNLTRFRPLDH